MSVIPWNTTGKDSASPKPTEVKLTLRPIEETIKQLLDDKRITTTWSRIALIEAAIANYRAAGVDDE